MTPDPAASWQVIQHHSKSFALAALALGMLALARRASRALEN
jgi:hypothetical protein